MLEIIAGRWVAVNARPGTSTIMPGVPSRGKRVQMQHSSYAEVWGAEEKRGAARRGGVKVQRPIEVCIRKRSRCEACRPSSRPRTAVLGYVESDDAFHDIAQYSNARTWPQLVIVRVDASLYFANARFVEDRVRERLALQPAAKWVVMNMSGVNDIDAVAAATLRDLMDELSPHGLRFAFVGMKLQVRSVIHRAGWDSTPDRIREFPTLRHAVSELVSSRPFADR